MKQSQLQTPSIRRNIDALSSRMHRSSIKTLLGPVEPFTKRVGYFCFSHTSGVQDMVTTAACECGAENQTAYHKTGSFTLYPTVQMN